MRERRPGGSGPIWSRSGRFGRRVRPLPGWRRAAVLTKIARQSPRHGKERDPWQAPRRRSLSLGGTGFLGRRVVRHLLDHGFAVRVAVRHPERAAALFPENVSLTTVQADVDDDASVAQALVGAWGLVNAVSLYVEKGGRTFHGVHVEAAARVAAMAHRAGVQRLIQVSGLGADPHASSDYVRSRGEGDAAVCEAFPGAIDHPALGDVCRRRRLDGRPRRDAPHGAGLPDVRRRRRPGCSRPLSGTWPRRWRVFSRRRNRPRCTNSAGRRRRPTRRCCRRSPAGSACAVSSAGAISALAAAAAVAEWLPNPPLTTGMVDLMRQDNVVSGAFPGFEALEIAPQAIETVLGGGERH